MTAAELTRSPLAPADVPSKCASESVAGSPAYPCPGSGSLPRCQLCPDSPTYWRLTEIKTSEGVTR